MWSGEGWIRTRRQLGVASFLGLFVAEIGFHVGVPIGLYGLIASLLGLDVLADLLVGLGVRNRK